MSINNKVKAGVIIGTTAMCTIVTLTIINGALKLIIEKVEDKNN